MIAECRLSAFPFHVKRPSSLNYFASAEAAGPQQSTPWRGSSARRTQLFNLGLGLWLSATARVGGTIREGKPALWCDEDLTSRRSIP